MKKKLNYKIIVGVPVFVIVVGLLTVAGLTRFTSQKNTPTAATLKPAEMIAQYQKIEAVTALYHKIDQPITNSSTVSYTSDKSYTISLPANNSVQLEQNDTSIKLNDTGAMGASEDFLSKQGLKKMNVGFETDLFEVFDSETTVCQLSNAPAFGDNGASLGLACIEKSAVTNQYSQINKLLALYTEDISMIANPSAIQIRTVTEGNKSLSITDIYGIKSDSGAVSLLFAAISDKWEYIGQRTISNGSVLIDNSISADLKTKINDPKYDDFLLKNVQ